MKIDLKKFDFSWNLFPFYAISFGIIMSHIHGWKAGAIQGLVYGLAMVLICGRRKPTEIKTDETIVFSMPKLFGYFGAIGFWFFFLVSLLFYPSLDIKTIWIFFIPLGFSVLCLYLTYTTGVQFLIGRTTLTIRKKIGFWESKKTFQLLDIVSCDIPWFQVLRLRFSNGQTLWLSAINDSLAHLKPYQGEIPNPQLEGLYRLKQELECRVDRLKEKSSQAQEHLFDQVPFNPIGILGFLVTGMCMITLSISLGIHLRTKGLSKIKTGVQKEIRQADIENTFFLYKGDTFFSLKADFEAKCQTHKDYNCRIAYYFNIIEDNEALHLIRMSCSPEDPHSCYNLYLADTATKTDKETSVLVLDEVCKSDIKDRDRTCCRCYFQERASRELASE